MAVNPPRICCIGGNLESETALSAILALGADVVSVVVPDGALASRTSDLADVPTLSERHNVRVIRTEDVNSDATISAIAQDSPDYIFVLGWSQLLGRRLLDLPVHYVVGSHPSDLPYGRGRAPIAWTILEGASQTAVTLFQMDEGVDTGGILHKELVDIPERAHAQDLYELTSATLAAGFVKLYQRMSKYGPPAPQPQGGHATYRHGRRDEDGFLDFKRSALEIDRLIRAASRPYPGAYGFLNADRVRVYRSLGYRADSDISAVPGQVIDAEGDWIDVATNGGMVRVAELRLDNGDAASPGVGSRFEVIGGTTLARLHDLERRITAMERM